MEPPLEFYKHERICLNVVRGFDGYNARYNKYILGIIGIMLSIIGIMLGKICSIWEDVVRYGTMWWNMVRYEALW